jgi:hypothetical protein
LIFSALKESLEDEFKLIIMQLYDSWRRGQGDGANITIMQLLARADSEYKRLCQLGQWTTRNKSNDLIGLQAEFDTLKIQFAALVAEKKTKETDQPPPPKRPTGEPKPEENEERFFNGEKWYYCAKCYHGRSWNKTHKTEHKRGAGKRNQKTDKDTDKNASQLASYDLGYGSDFQSG